jgi:hypothetical protein
MKKTYTVTAQVTISLVAEVEAESTEEAENLAYDLRLPSLCNQCGGTQGGDSWSTSGEFDGEPERVRVEAEE